MKNAFILPNLDEARKRNKEVAQTYNFSLDPKYLHMGDNKRYYIVSHGCQANVRDSEAMAGILDELGYNPSETKENADVVIFNTCAIRQGAEEKVFGEIGALKKAKNNNPDLIICFAGCMAQEEHTVKTIIEKYPWVNVIFGTHNIHDLPRLLYETMESKRRKVEVYSKMGEIIEEVPVTRMFAHKASVNIMYGCNKFCTYCIVPYTRGKERSRRPIDVIKEVEELVKQGYKEVTLLGQNVNAYGKDLGIDYTFGNLLDDVSKTNIPRIRFMTSHPWDFDDTMIEAIKNNKNIMPSIHLPLQSGNDHILMKMNRRYTSEEYKALFDKLKANIPNAAFTTDIIVGFPNETEEMFLDTLKMVDYCKYDNAFTFIFSPRTGTPAAKMEDSITHTEKEQRLARLNEKVAYYANQNNQKYKDQIVEVLVDGLSKKNDKVYSGYTPEGKLVNFTGDNIKIGELVNVKIIETLSFSLNGILVK